MAPSTTYTEKEPYDNGTSEDDLYDMQDWSYSNQPPSYDQVHRPESLWQPYYMEAYENHWKLSMTSNIWANLE